MGEQEEESYDVFLRDELIEQQAAEIAALRECLKWYAEKCISLSVYSNAKPPLDAAILALMHEMLLDAGKRAESLLTREASE